MAIDVYVMPMWRFRSGDFESSLAIFARKQGISFSVIRSGLSVSPRRLLRRFFAQRYVRKLQTTLSKSIGKSVSWEDEGETLYNHQFHSFYQLLAYTKWLDLKDEIPEFELSERGSADAHPTWKFNRPHWTYPLINALDCYSGIIVPSDFPNPVHIPEKLWDGTIGTRKIFSSHALLCEINVLNLHLNVPEGWDHKNSPKHLFWPMSCLYQLRDILRLSIEHQLPVMFDG